MKDIYVCNYSITYLGYESLPAEGQYANWRGLRLTDDRVVTTTCLFAIVVSIPSPYTYEQGRYSSFIMKNTFHL